MSQHPTSYEIIEGNKTSYAEVENIQQQHSQIHTKKQNKYTQLNCSSPYGSNLSGFRRTLLLVRLFVPVLFPSGADQ